ncbi:MAG: hypothetical protein C0184_04590 [Chloroflexus aggregans]|uniref:Uncharacterized protein n=1 Tax=Chloroflexus aggregans TaxID=152260 RepID=A0A2J6X961_9CHLR|nr:MAG: hypothetical protein C0184_04590 [Chloroflexus aggregans]
MIAQTVVLVSVIRDAPPVGLYHHLNGNAPPITVLMKPVPTGYDGQMYGMMVARALSKPICVDEDVVTQIAKRTVKCRARCDYAHEEETSASI